VSKRSLAKRLGQARRTHDVPSFSLLAKIARCAETAALDRFNAAAINRSGFPEVSVMPK
jgi:hypothetical protein